MGVHPSGYKGTDHPDEKVGWTDAVEFCRSVGRSEVISAKCEIIFVISFKKPVSEIIATYCREEGDFVLFSSIHDHWETLPERL